VSPSPGARRRLCALACAAALALAPGGCGPGGEGAAGDARPEFELPRLGGGTLRLSELRGRTVLIDFWATWCEPCVDQVPGLNALWREQGQRGLAVLGIAVDVEGASVVGPWVEEYGVEYPILLGDEGLAFDFGVLGFPALVVITPEGELGPVHMGVASREELLALVSGRSDPG
jgi:peroxiredoxin